MLTSVSGMALSSSCAFIYLTLTADMRGLFYPRFTVEEIKAQRCPHRRYQWPSAFGLGQLALAFAPMASLDPGYC